MTPFAIDGKRCHGPLINARCLLAILRWFCKKRNPRFSVAAKAAIWDNGRMTIPPVSLILLETVVSGTGE